MKRYIGKVMETENNAYKITFLRRLRDMNKFQYPSVSDEAWIDPKGIAAKVNMIQCGRTSRQNRTYEICQRKIFCHSVPLVLKYHLAIFFIIFRYSLSLRFTIYSDEKAEIAGMEIPDEDSDSDDTYHRNHRPKRMLQVQIYILIGAKKANARSDILDLIRDSITK